LSPLKRLPVASSFIDPLDHYSPLPTPPSGGRH
jgi:hypothetical protein